MPGPPPPSPVLPWHMWGTTKTVTLTQGTGTNVATTQIARVNYRRADTWRFFFGGKLYMATTDVANVVVRARVDLILGVGRSNFPTEQVGVTDIGFATFQWNVPAGSLPGALQTAVKYTSKVRTPLLDDSDATSYQEIDLITAQDIQAGGRISIVAASVGTQVSVQLSAFFAPNVHVRPDWFWEDVSEKAMNARRFTGAEVGGT